MHYIPFQLELEAYLPPVVGNKDYLEYKNILDRIDTILQAGRIEQELVNMKMKSMKKMSQKQSMRFQKQIIRAFRCNIIKDLTKSSFRELSMRLADSYLYQKFCHLISVDKIEAPSKSTLEIYSKMFDESEYRELANLILKQASEVAEDGQANFGLESAVSHSEYYFDSTCVEANIHFPVDWILLRDACRTLMKAVVLIRKQGLKNRMSSPESFIKEMNQLCICMTHSRRKKGSKKHRKLIYRLMKQLIKTVKEHALKHRQLLDEKWESTEYSRNEADQIIKRIDDVLEKLPKAVKQAQERIIGGRLVESKDKILSLYENDINVIVRGKAGAEVEFGNTLMIAEQANGLVVDWEFVKEQSPGDPTLIKNILKRTHKSMKILPQAVAGDRGCKSKDLDSYLKENEIYNGTCPKDVYKLRILFQDEKFEKLQTRRSQTEARISILKNGFFGKPMRSKGFEYRKTEIASSIFAHNLWVIARLPVAEAEGTKKKAA